MHPVLSSALIFIFVIISFVDILRLFVLPKDDRLLSLSNDFYGHLNTFLMVVMMAVGLQED